MFFACMQLRDKKSCWHFEKTFVLKKKLLFWPSEVALAFIPAPCSGVVRSSCLGVWFAELDVNSLPPLEASCSIINRQRGLGRSIFRSGRWENSAFFGKRAPLSVTWRTWYAMRDATYCTVLALCTHSTKLNDFFLRRCMSGKLFSVPWIFGFVFRDQWDKNFQTR